MIKIIKRFTSRGTRLRRNESRQIVQFDANVILIQQLLTHDTYTCKFNLLYMRCNMHCISLILYPLSTVLSPHKYKLSGNYLIDYSKEFKGR